MDDHNERTSTMPGYLPTSDKSETPRLTELGRRRSPGRGVPARLGPPTRNEHVVVLATVGLGHQSLEHLVRVGLHAVLEVQLGLLSSGVVDVVDLDDVGPGIDQP